MAVERSEFLDLERRTRELESRLDRLEPVVVRRNGPLVDELHAATGAVHDLTRETVSREELRRELAAQTAELDRRREAARRERAEEGERAFTRREKLAALGVAVFVLGLNVVQTIAAVQHP